MKYEHNEVTKKRLMDNVCKLLAFVLLFSGSGISVLFPADSFPPAWSVGDTWTVHVKQYMPNIEERVPGSDPDPEAPPIPPGRPYSEKAKIYQVTGVEDVAGRPAFKLKISIPETGESFVLRVDQEKRYFIDCVVTSASGSVQEEENRVAPKDSVFGSIPGSTKYLLDFVVFPVPNVNEERVVAVPGAVELEGYTQKIEFSPAIAQVTCTKSDSAGVTAIYSQTWKAGDKWPESATRKIPAQAGGMEDDVVETLVR